jgi:hypothetical protein
MSSYISTGVACLPVIGPIVSAFYPFCSDAKKLEAIFKNSMQDDKFHDSASSVYGLMKKRYAFAIQVRDILFEELRAVELDTVSREVLPHDLEMNRYEYYARWQGANAVCAAAETIWTTELQEAAAARQDFTGSIKREFIHALSNVVCDIKEVPRIASVPWRCRGDKGIPPPPVPFNSRPVTSLPNQRSTQLSLHQKS